LSSYIQQGIVTLDLYNFIDFHDIIFLIFSLSVAVFIFTIQFKNVRKILFYIVFPIYFILIGVEVNLRDKYTDFPAFFNNPFYPLAISYFKSLNQFKSIEINLDKKQFNSIRLIDSDFTQKTSGLKNLTLNQVKDWNIVIFVLESVGYDYIFQKTTNGNLAMPNLKNLSTKGLWFSNNYSGGNISALGQFSLLTGLYPNPIPTRFEFQKNLHLPTVANWAGKNYDSFLVSPSNDLFFSMGINKTFSQYANAKSINPRRQKLIFNMFLPELEGLKYFQDRILKASKPFLAVYWTNATHFPYYNYSSLQDLQSLSLFSQYIRNLQLVDHEIQSIYDLLKNNKLIENTIFIVVGDHGESFGQHNHWAHGQTLYQEEIKVPLLIIAPNLFKPAVIKSVKSSIDILPTLLDAMKRNFGENLQGESIFSKNNTRKYVFVYGDQDDIAMIDNNSMKTIMSFNNNSCVRFNLNIDPHEKNDLSCNVAEQKIILKFRKYQPHILSNITATSRYIS